MPTLTDVRHLTSNIHRLYDFSHQGKDLKLEELNHHKPYRVLWGCFIPKVQAQHTLGEVATFRNCKSKCVFFMLGHLLRERAKSPEGGLPCQLWNNHLSIAWGSCQGWPLLQHLVLVSVLVGSEYKPGWSDTVITSHMGLLSNENAAGLNWAVPSA